MKTKYLEMFSRLKMKKKQKRNFDDEILLGSKGDDEGKATLVAKIESISR